MKHAVPLTGVIIGTLLVCCGAGSGLGVASTMRSPLGGGDYPWSDASGRDETCERHPARDVGEGFASRSPLRLWEGECSDLRVASSEGRSEGVRIKQPAEAVGGQVPEVKHGHWGPDQGRPR